MDQIIIEQLRVDTLIGVHAWERVVKQTLLVTVALGGDVRTAAMNDRLSDAIDYVQIANRIVAFADKNQFQLIETFAEQLAQLLLKEFAIAKVTIDVRKPGAVAQAMSVGVHIERSSEKK